jgi:hypothetical protein
MNITELPEIAHVFTFDAKIVEEVKSEVDVLRKKSLDLLPFEKEQVANLIEQKTKNVSDIRNNYNPLDERFKRIDMDFISKLKIWNNTLKCYVPRFAIYNMNNKVLKMELEHSMRIRNNTTDEYVIVKVGSHNSENFLKNYSETKLLSKWDYIMCHGFSDDRRERTITHKFEGFLPDEIRDIVKDVTNNAKKDNFNINELYLIEESYKWTSSFKTIKEPVRNLDPVIVGIRDDIAYYICSFDVTPAEKFLVSEMVG